MRYRILYRYFRRKIAVKQKAFEERLERKRIERQIKESQIPYSHCKNCGTALQGVYCHNCGQYAKDLKQSFGSYVMEYLSNTYNLDGRIFQTIWLLFRKPGFLTKEFLQGKINSYVHPLKLNMFLLLVVMMVFAFSITRHNANTQAGSIEEYDEMKLPELIIKQLNSLDGYITELSRHNKSIELIAPYHIIKDNPAVFEIVNVTSANDNRDMDTLTVSTSQWMIDEKILIKSNDGYYTFTDEKSIFKDKSKEGQLIREQFLSFYQSYLPIFIILLSPILALILWGMNVREKQGFITHFIFSLHYSAFLEFIMLLFLVMTNIFDSTFVFWCTVGLIVGMTVYLITAFKVVYSGTSWYSATWKALCINIIYTVSILAASLALLVLFINSEK
ncbi:MAG: DUF3667 domain-containing protein [Bacteroides sp.]|nr:DUF3667 domain-containing protein [Bacteroides sp.]